MFVVSSFIEGYTTIIGWVTTAPAWQSIIAILAGALLLGKVLEVLLEQFAPYLLEQTNTRALEILVERSPVGIYTTVLVAGGYLSLLALDIPAQIQTPAENTFLTMFVSVWTVVVIQIGRNLSDLGKTRKGVDDGLIPIFQNIWTLVVGVVGVFIVFSVWGIDVTPFLASAGIVGIAVGFAAKDTIANFFGSIALYIDGTYSVGDYIVLDSGEEGWVNDISIRSTQIRTRDDLMVTVPNSMLNSGKVVNESTPTPKRRMRVHVGVDYTEDVDRVIEVLRDIAMQEEMVDDVPEPQVMFKEFDDSALTFILLAWIPNPATRPKVEHNLNRRVQQRFAEEGISIPYPQRVLSDRKGRVEMDDGQE